MLKYLISVTENLTVLAILLGFLHAHLSRTYEDRGRVSFAVGTLSGLAVAIVYAVLRYTTKVIDRSGGNGMWNVRRFAVSLAALLIFAIFSIPALRKKLGRAGQIVPPVAAGLLAFTYVFYALPEVLAAPWNFNLNGASAFSTAFFTRFTGYLFGIVLAIVLLVAVACAAGKADSKLATGLMFGAMFLNAFEQVTKSLQVLYSKRIISGHAIFVLVKNTSNYSNLFIYASMLIAAALAAVLWARSFNVREPYDNVAQHRRIKAKWRSIRRWSTTILACCLIGVLTLTVFYAIDNRVVELSPTEECEQRDGSCWIPLTQVEDGHLHRFEYITPNGITVRFIIIKKPNSSAYGVGLDACDICGETGYFERNGQIVCKLCDVVMNINTIGFKGGCNPIVIDYSVADGFINVPFESLIEHEDEFK